jgi:CBS-domain-containing membrane protein
VQASDVLTREVVPVGPETPAEVAGQGFAALPVVDGGRLGGIVSRRGLLRRRSARARGSGTSCSGGWRAAPVSWDVTAPGPTRAAPANA